MPGALRPSAEAYDPPEFEVGAPSAGDGERGGLGKAAAIQLIGDDEGG